MKKNEDMIKTENKANNDYLSIARKFNPYHDKLGRFTTADGANLMTFRTNDSSKQYLADRWRSNHEKDVAQKNKGTATTTVSVLNNTNDTAKESKSSNAITKKYKRKPIDWDNDGYVSGITDIVEFANFCDSVLNGVSGVQKAIETKYGGEKQNNKVGYSPTYEVNELIGNNKTPKVISHSEFEKAIKKGNPDFYRGFSNKKDDSGAVTAKGTQFAQDFLNGTNYVGGGVYGNGVYATKKTKGIRGSGLDTAKDYASTNGAATDNVVRFTLKNNANIQSYTEVMSEYYGFVFKISRSKSELASDNTHQAKEALEKLDNYSKLFTDVGTYAAARGYDGYVVDDDGEESDYYCLFNRGAIIVDENLISSD